MHFDDSFFEDIASNKKEEKKQYPYSVRRQDFRVSRVKKWFLSDDSNCADSIRVIEQMKYKADYLYAQSRYTEATKCYEQLSVLIPSSNTVLTQEVCESQVMCLTKIAKTDEAERCLKGKIDADKMNTTLWHLMFTIQRDKGNLEEATYTIQQCLKDDEEVSSFWIDLAETYGLCSTCFDWPSELTTCQFVGQIIMCPEELGQSLVCESNKNDAGKAIKESMSCYGEGKELLDKELDKERVENTVVLTEKGSIFCNAERKEFVEKELLKNKHAKNEAKQDILSTGVLNCSIEDSNVTELDTTDNEEGLCLESEELRSFVKNHHYCYCALCSLIISRFLLCKYPARSQFTKQERKHENKVNFMISNVTCATDKIVNEVRKLVNVKFADRIKSSHSSRESENMAKKVQEFNKHWFPLK